MNTPSLSSAMASSSTFPATPAMFYSVISAAAPAVSSSAPYLTEPGQVPGGDRDNGECKLLGPFSLVIQAALGALALLSLVFKRWRERPQRPLKVWAFDVSKQVVGTAMLHLANLLMSMFSAGQFEIRATFKPNPCSFYLLNLGIDTTLGIGILIFLLRLLNGVAYYTPLANPPQSIESGNYGHPPRTTWWLKQSLIYFMGLLGMKICVFFIIQLVPFVVKIGDWALQWTEGNTAVQIFFVMLLFPVIMNAIQYYIIDGFIKKQPTHELYLAEDEGEDRLGNDADRRALLADLDDEATIGSDNDSIGKGPQATAQKETIPHHHEDEQYRSSTSSGSSSHVHDPKVAMNSVQKDHDDE